MCNFGITGDTFQGSMRWQMKLHLPASTQQRFKSNMSLELTEGTKLWELDAPHTIRKLLLHKDTTLQY